MGKLLSFLLRGAFHLHKYDVIGRASSSDESCNFVHMQVSMMQERGAVWRHVYKKLTFCIEIVTIIRTHYFVCMHYYYLTLQHIHRWRLVC